MKNILLLLIFIPLITLSACAQGPAITTEKASSTASSTPSKKETMTGKKIIFVAVPNFRDPELIIPKNILISEGAEISIASLKKGNFVGNEGTTVEADYELSEVNPNDFDAMVFVGGPGMSHELENKDLQDLAKKFYQSGKLTAAICVAPAVLANAGILKDKKATVFPTAKGYLIEAGADYTAQAVTIDGSIITADGPESSTAFANEIIKYFN